MVWVLGLIWERERCRALEPIESEGEGGGKRRVRHEDMRQGEKGESSTG